MIAPNRLEFLWLPSFHGFAFRVASLISLVSTRISQNGRSYSIANHDHGNKILSERTPILFHKRENLQNNVVKGAIKPYPERKRCTF
jgi:hypothetical protein